MCVCSRRVCMHCIILLTLLSTAAFTKIKQQRQQQQTNKRIKPKLCEQYDLSCETAAATALFIILFALPLYDTHTVTLTLTFCLHFLFHISRSRDASHKCINLLLYWCTTSVGQQLRNCDTQCI